MYYDLKVGNLLPGLARAIAFGNTYSLPVYKI